MRELQRWEKDLLADTCDFVKFCTERLNIPIDKGDELVARIYADMHRTLVLFHDKD
jgi:hypothetical protein